MSGDSLNWTGKSQTGKYDQVLPAWYVEAEKYYVVTSLRHKNDGSQSVRPFCSKASFDN